MKRPHSRFTPHHYPFADNSVIEVGQYNKERSTASKTILVESPKTIARNPSFRRASIPQEWNDRPPLATKTRCGPKRPEGASLCRLTAQYPTKSRCFLPRLHDLHLTRLARPGASQVRARLGHFAVETKRPWHSHAVCGRSRRNGAGQPPTSRPGTARMMDRWMTNRRHTLGIF